MARFRRAPMQEASPSKSPAGFRVPPRWQIVPPGAPTQETGITLIVAPGSGFGSGNHPTTRLSLQAIAALAPSHGGPWRMLDFGSGSGILSLAAARLGATVEGVEIDASAIRGATENVRLNGLEGRIRFSEGLEGVVGPFELIVANILRSVLLDHASELIRRLAPGGTLVLGGLVATDVPELSVRYAAELGGRRPEVYQLDEWRALVWRSGQP